MGVIRRASPPPASGHRELSYRAAAGLDFTATCVGDWRYPRERGRGGSQLRQAAAIVAADYSRSAERAAAMRDQLRDHGVDATVLQGNISWPDGVGAPSQR
jgi:hypothetical protein